ncbi:tryptophan halogenase family protein [Catenovulum sp. SX2]|uniref:tryptophan halogenase family protein n=1 Tax=Catenovulum sp. SX2 TaxID=3398614 RepID=UPI003F879D9A
MVNKVVILGGGSAGWMCAAFLSRVFTNLQISLVESNQYAPVGVGEATIPPIQLFNQILKIDEADFIQYTHATYKLGIQFNHWGKQGQSYLHAFGEVGKPLGLIPFIHYWLRAAKQQQLSVDDFWQYSLNAQAAAQNQFVQAKHLAGTRLPGLTYAYHFDAALYADFLERISVQNGVSHIQGEVIEVLQNPQTLDISALKLADGQIIEGDLFIDCSGFKALLIDKSLNTPYQDWSHYLPADRAVVVQTDAKLPLLYTQANAHKFGWSWQIPLKSRTGNGLVYSSKFASDDWAINTLLHASQGQTLHQPRIIQFKTGRYTKPWHKNVIAVGLASGFVEPMESTSLHMVQSSLLRLLKLMPNGQITPASQNMFNQLAEVEAERIRDFIVLHYFLNQRGDSKFWQHMRTMPIPESLQQKLDLFRQTGQVIRQQDELFSESSWQQVMLGQGLVPDNYHPLAEQISQQQLDDFCASFKAVVRNSLN